MSTLVVLVVLFQRLQDPNPHVRLRIARVRQIYLWDRVGTIGNFVAIGHIGHHRLSVSTSGLNLIRFLSRCLWAALGP